MNSNFRENERQKRAQASLLSLARRIRALRERRGLTQEEFAVRCGISVSFASLLERGERSPSYETLLDMAQTLDVPVSELFSDVPLEMPDEPYFAKLLEFARRARLSQAQVDRMIAVGHAMFGVEPKREMPRVDMEGDLAVCAFEGCVRPVLAKGLCASHYHRKRRASR